MTKRLTSGAVLVTALLIAVPCIAQDTAITNTDSCKCRAPGTAPTPPF